MRSASSAELYRPAFPPDEGQHTCSVPSASGSVRFEIGDRVLISGSDEEGVITGVRYGERVYDNAPVAGSKICCLSRFGLAPTRLRAGPNGASVWLRRQTRCVVP